MKVHRPPPDRTDAAGWRKEALQLRHQLADLTMAVAVHISNLDALMQRPATTKRGTQIAQVMSDLETANDRARYFGLGIDYRTDKKRKA